MFFLNRLSCSISIEHHYVGLKRFGHLQRTKSIIKIELPLTEALFFSSLL